MLLFRGLVDALTSSETTGSLVAVCNHNDRGVQEPTWYFSCGLPLELPAVHTQIDPVYGDPTCPPFKAKAADGVEAATAPAWNTAPKAFSRPEYPTTRNVFRIHGFSLYCRSVRQRSNVSIASADK
jgi:hypothetical protein